MGWDLMPCLYKAHFPLSKMSVRLLRPLAAPSPRRPRLEVLFSSLFIRNFLYGGRGINPCQVRACNPFASEMFSQNVFGVVVLHM